MKDELYGNQIQCPYCEQEYTDSYELGCSDGDFEEEECTNCGKNFTWSCVVDVSYTCKADCELNGVSHDWQLESMFGNKDDNYFICNKCPKCKIEPRVASA